MQNKLHFLFATETGTAEYLADDLSDSVADEFDCEVTSLQHMDPVNLQSEAIYVIVSSTFGMGDVPNTAQTFLDKLNDNRPDLTAVRFAVFGLGDQSFGETYNQGSEKLMAALLACNATMVGERGLYDSSASDESPEDLGIPWLKEIIAKLKEDA
ncbi:MAG: flavodoxin domain-containing protein [Pseudomonadota bacterium]